VPDDELVSVEVALVVIQRRGVSVEEWSQAIADGLVPSWPHRDGRLRVRLSDATTWRPKTVSPAVLEDLVRRRRSLDAHIDHEVQRLHDDGTGWIEIAEILGVTERQARRSHEARPKSPGRQHH
jgi:hypothetical protein